MIKPYYQDDYCTIYHGDCREILPKLENKIDLIITDPPYAVSIFGSSFNRHEGKGSRNYDFFEGDDNWQEMQTMVEESVFHMIKKLKENGTIFIWVGHRMFGSILSILELHEFSTRPIAWVKKVPIPCPPNAGFDSALELGIYGYKQNRTFNTHKKYKSNVIFSDSYRHGQPGKVDHPTQKPFPTISPFIEIASNRGELILDPFMGSGTTLRAAKDLRRKAIGIEISEKYCEIAVNRLRQEVLPL